MARIDLITLFTDVEGNKYNIHMTDHTQCLVGVSDVLCKFIFDTAIGEAGNIWTGWVEVMPGNFVFWIPPESPLCVYLDAEALAQHPYNALCFTRNGNQITITNFGPFGWNKGCTPMFPPKGGELVARDRLHNVGVVVAKIGAKEGLKYFFKDEPECSFLTELAFSARRALNGDVVGALTEAFAGAASLLLGKDGKGTAASRVTNMSAGALLMKDLYVSLK